MQINKFWKLTRDLLKKPSEHQEAREHPKPAFLSMGEIFKLYA